jgi:hypothetical protein
MVTLYPGGEGDPAEQLGPTPRRIVLRGHNEESDRNQMYTALVSCDDGGPFRSGSAQQLVTLRLAGEDVLDYLQVGSNFDLWLGNDIGKGVITRRLYV